VQAEYPEYSVEHERHACQVAGILNKGNTEKHEHDKRYKPQDAANAVNNAGNDK